MEKGKNKQRENLLQTEGVVQRVGKGSTEKQRGTQRHAKREIEREE